MSVPAAYLGVILIWTTTPLAIKWSGEGAGYLFGVTGRMLISAVVALAIVRLMRLSMPWHRAARHTYLAAGMGIYAAMLCTYWAAQFIPSGWISVVFGLTPIFTGLLSFVWLGDRNLTPLRLFGLVFAVGGLLVIFYSGLAMGLEVVKGVLAVVMATLFHSASSVWVKRLDAGLHGLSLTAGSLLVAVPLFLLTWFVTGSEWPLEVADRAAWSIIYLALFGSVVGFSLYYFVLRKVAATRVALITLVTPVTALLLGSQLNGELLQWRVWLGTSMILTGLICFEMRVDWRRLLRVAR